MPKRDKGNRVHPTEPQKPKHQVNPEGYLSNHLLFSFAHYDMDRAEYCISRWSEDHTKLALFRLKEVSQWTLRDMKDKAKILHFHEVDWAQTEEPDGFGDPALEELPNFQFALLNVNQKKTRVFGALVGSTFYIVWFDLNHKVWPGKAR